jgi:hypothetical protein
MATRSSRLANAFVPQAPDLRLEEVQLTDTSITVRVTSTAPTACRVRKVHPIKNVQNPVQYFMINPIGLKNG